MKRDFLSKKPETIGQWIVFLAAVGIVLSSPTGTRKFLRELGKYISSQHSGFLDGYNNHDLSQAIYYLKKRKIIKIEKSGDQTIIKLTEKGRKRSLQFDLDRMEIKKQIKWDQKWRLIMFDIPESQKLAREVFREKLKGLGFYQFQKSVWIYPYPCEDEIDFIAESFSIAPFINFITVQMMEDKPLKEYFKLS